MRKRLVRRLAALALLPGIAAAAAESPDIEVKVQVDGGDVHIESSVLVDATPQEVWAVLTDFEHMPQFISNLRSSKVVARSGDTVTIAQSWEASFGPLGFISESTRELRLAPYELIRSRLVSGNIKRFESVTRLRAEDGGTRITYVSDTDPGRWIPPVVGPHFIEHEAREQFAETRREILRRKAAAASPPL